MAGVLPGEGPRAGGQPGGGHGVHDPSLLRAGIEFRGHPRTRGRYGFGEYRSVDLSEDRGKEAYNTILHLNHCISSREGPQKARECLVFRKPSPSGGRT